MSGMDKVLREEGWPSDDDKLEIRNASYGAMFAAMTNRVIAQTDSLPDPDGFAVIARAAFGVAIVAASQVDGAASVASDAMAKVKAKKAAETTEDSPPDG